VFLIIFIPVILFFNVLIQNDIALHKKEISKPEPLPFILRK